MLDGFYDGFSYLRRVDTYLSCPCLATFTRRKAFILQLPPDVRSRIALNPAMASWQQLQLIFEACMTSSDKFTNIYELVKYYDGATPAFANLVAHLKAERLLSVDEPPQNFRYTTKMTEKKQELLAEYSKVIEPQLTDFVGRVQELTTLEQKIDEKLVTGGYITLTGQAGQGKSTFIAKLVDKQRKAQERELENSWVTYHFIPRYPSANYRVKLLQSLIVQLSLKYDFPCIYSLTDDLATLQEYLLYIFEEIAAKCWQEVIFIDGLDYLVPKATDNYDLSFLPASLPAGIVFVLGLRSFLAVSVALQSSNIFDSTSEYSLPALSISDFRDLLEDSGIDIVLFSDALVAHFYNLSQANTFLATLLAQELKLWFATNNSVEGFIEKANNLFTFMFDRLKQATAANFPVLQEALGLLLVAQEPLPLLAIKQILQQEKLEDSELAEIIHKLDTLVAQTPQGDYCLAQPAFAEFLTPSNNLTGSRVFNNQVSIIAAHASLADWCAGTEDSLGVSTQTDTLARFRQDYNYKNYIVHLYFAEEWRKLLEVLYKGDYGRTKVKHFGKQAHISDLELGELVIYREAVDLQHKLDFLPTLWRFILLRNILLDSDESIYASPGIMAAWNETTASSLHSLVDILAWQSHFEVALTIANAIESASTRKWSLTGIIHALVFANQLDKALAVANSMDCVENKSEIFDFIIQSLFYNSYNNYDDKIEQAIAIAKSNPVGLSKKAVILALNNQLEEAYTIIDSMEKPRKEGALKDLVNYFGTVHKFEQANSVMNLVKNTSPCGYIMPDFAFAFALAKAGRVDEALVIARSEKIPEFGVVSLLGISGILARTNQTEQADSIFAEILLMARSGTSLSNCLFYIAYNTAEQVAAILNYMQTLDIATKDYPDGDPYLKRELTILNVILEDFEQALITANSIADETSKLQAYAKIVTGFVKANRLDDAAKLVFETWQTVTNKSTALSSLEVALPLLKIHPHLGTAFFETFKWVEDFA